MQVIHANEYAGEPAPTPAMPIDPVIWAAECEELTEGFTNLLWISRHSFSATGVIELVRLCPIMADDVLLPGEPPPTSLLARSVQTMFSIGGIPQASRESAIKAVRKLASMPPDRRALMEASICGVLLGVSIARS